VNVFGVANERLGFQRKLMIKGETEKPRDEKKQRGIIVIMGEASTAICLA